MLHANHAGHLKILIRTVDTDVAVLAVSVAETLGPEYELWLAFGTGRHLAAPLRTKALPIFHALTDCDTVSRAW